MKMTNFYFGIIVILVLISSCTSVLDNKIESETLEVTVTEIKETNPNLDSLKLYVLDNLIRINKGRETFVEDLNSKLTTDLFSYDEYIVNDDKFNEHKDNMFKYFKSNEVSYADLFTEIDTINEIEKRFDLKAQSTFIEIDKFCIEKQLEVEAKKRKQEEVKAKLNEMVDIKILSIRKTEYDYRDLIEVKIQMINRIEHRNLLKQLALI